MTSDLFILIAEQGRLAFHNTVKKHKMKGKKINSKKPETQHQTNRNCCIIAIERYRLQREGGRGGRERKRDRVVERGRERVTDRERERDKQRERERDR